ncbi:DUF378 domain-containing protein [Thiotrichales bacterium 19S11-10]|nr:DUF378 domain-containing protein [Thiotrichales bacterium 19S11-10]MCF6807416.1 DUF378 domain-containing protein [Thiotrichales bacterium 19S9-11]MCF6811385.1 DUF378 domain-containing protein [Thiotrichales bacterium 19S9-12]
MCKLLDVIAVILVIIAALNYGIGVFHMDILHMIFGEVKWLMMLVQVVIGLAGIYMIIRCPKMCKSSCGATVDHHHHDGGAQ